jgi:NAD(P)-dependent dehydrogenase (short-subunit alcohol dehydrogenase family)
VGTRPFEGQAAIVTGAASGIGLAIAKRLAAGGAAVTIVDQNGEGAEAAADQLRAAGAQACAVQADVSKSAEVRAAVARATAEFGAPAILVNNAGISRGGRVQDIAEEDWDLVLAVNLRGCYLFCKNVVPAMVEARYGRIVNIASGTAVRVGPGSGPYAASKAGIIALTKSVAGEVARMGITANVVAPGLTDTAMTRGQFGDEERLQQEASAGRIANPMRVVIQPEDIASAVAFLALPESRYITGQTLHVNAGSFMP